MEDIDAATFGSKKVTQVPVLNEAPKQHEEAYDLTGAYPVLNVLKFKTLSDSLSLYLGSNRLLEEDKFVQDLSGALSGIKLVPKDGINFVPKVKMDKIKDLSGTVPEEVRTMVSYLLPDVSAWSLDQFRDPIERRKIDSYVNESYSKLDKLLKPGKVERDVPTKSRMDDEFSKFVNRDDIRDRLKVASMLRELAQRLLLS